VKLCKHCLTEQPDEVFGICLVRGEKVYRRQQCQKCKQARAGERKAAHRHPDGQGKEFAIGDMLKDNRSITAVECEIAKCVVLCTNCHLLEHSDEGIMRSEAQVLSPRCTFPSELSSVPGLVPGNVPRPPTRMPTAMPRKNRDHWALT
jgi:hypothetical protein